MSITDILHIPTGKLDAFIRSVEISSYMPGRIRLYSKNLVNNPTLEQTVKGNLAVFSEISEVETNTVTGSILIKYEPHILRKNSELLKAEQYIMNHAPKHKKG